MVSTIDMFVGGSVAIIIDFFFLESQHTCIERPALYQALCKPLRMQREMTVWVLKDSHFYASII